MDDEIPRQSDRVPLGCEIEFRRHGDTRYRVELIDLSPQGCQIAPPIRVQTDESVWLRVAGLEAIHASVCWAKEWRVGLEFDQPLHPAVFDMLVKRLGG